MKDANLESFDAKAEARASPLSKAFWPMLMFFATMVLLFFVLEAQFDPILKTIFVGMNAVAAFLWVRTSYRRYMLQYWFRQIVITEGKHLEHVRNGKDKECSCMKKIKEYILEWTRR